MTRMLTLDDILDLRAYERQRDDLLARVIEIKQRRRVAVGPIVTLLFENRETVRSQIQEMARAERLATDAQIESELRAYNPLIPEPGQLSATLFIELTSSSALREWLPKLVGIESAPELRLGSGEHAAVVRASVDEAHAAQLTRETVTAAVHYVHFDLTPAHVELFAAGPVAVAINHPAYQESTTLTSATHQELLTDLRP
ncbi:MAG: DUF3501 family protein [Chloroflexota bacterium]